MTTGRINQVANPLFVSFVATRGWTSQQLNSREAPCQEGRERVDPQDWGAGEVFLSFLS